jgi:hypothetical protein
MPPVPPARCGRPLPRGCSWQDGQLPTVVLRDKRWLEAARRSYGVSNLSVFETGAGTIGAWLLPATGCRKTLSHIPIVSPWRVRDF